MKLKLAVVAALVAVTVANVGIHFAPKGKEAKPAAPGYGDVIATAHGCPAQIPQLDLSNWTATAYAAQDEPRISVVCTPPIETGPAQ